MALTKARPFLSTDALLSLYYVLDTHPGASIHFCTKSKQTVLVYAVYIIDYVTISG